MHRPVRPVPVFTLPVCLAFGCRERRAVELRAKCSVLRTSGVEKVVEPSTISPRQVVLTALIAVQPSNFLLTRENPLALAQQPATATAALPLSGALRDGGCANPAAAAAQYDPLTGAYMADSSFSDDKCCAAAVCEGLDTEEEEPYTGGWLKGVDFGCSNEAPPGLLLCKMTVRMIYGPPCTAL